jgi:2-(1,2-epoxy-1,2-dihydrophenyl)acetyl-CoA isomerase
MLAELSEACRDALDPAVRAVVLTGSGRGFCSGADLKAARSDITPPSRRLRSLYNPAVVQLATLPKPVVAAVNGATVGAGLSLAGAADVRIASSAAVFAGGFIDVGLSTDTGSSYFLSRIMSPSDAFLFLSTGSRVDAAEAQRLGLVNEVVAPEAVLGRAEEIARIWAGKPAAALRELKLLLRGAGRATLAEQMEAELAAYDVTAADPERIAARERRAVALDIARN